MHALARALANKSVSWVVVVVTLVGALVCGLLAGTVEQEDDVLAFLPEGNKDIEAFQAINERFGGLDVALVGIETEDPFDPEFLTSLRQTTRHLKDLHGVDQALSITSLEDFYEDPVMGGVVTSELVDRIPTDDADREALREKVMSRDHVVGDFISPDGDAVLILVFATYGTKHRELASAVRGVVEPAFPDSKLFWGGAPFINSWIYDTTQADMRILTPFAVGTIIVIILVSFRDWMGSLLALAATGMGIVGSQAAMVVAGAEFNIVLSSMPVILFAVGSAYSIHMLSHYYDHRRTLSAAEAVEKTVARTGPTVLVAGLTTVAGLLSFVTMDIRPMRTFGLFTAIGIGICLVLSVTFVPAFVRVTETKRRAPEGRLFKQITLAIARGARNNRLTVGVGLGALTVAALFFVGKVNTQVDTSAFFSPGSEPELAERFLDEHFGGSQYVQVHVEGNLSDPGVVREVRRIGDQIRLLPLVSRVQDLSLPVSLVNDAMMGQRRVPENDGQLGVLYGFLAGNAGVGALLTEERDAALIQVKVSSGKAEDLERVLDAVQTIIEENAVTTYAVVPADEADDRVSDLVVARIRSLTKSFDAAIPDEDAVANALSAEVGPPPTERITAGVQAFLDSEENWVVLDEAQRDATVEATVALGRSPSEEAWRAALSEALAPISDEEAVETTVEDLLLVLEAPTEDVWAEVEATHRARALVDAVGIEVPEGAKGERFVRGVSMALLDRGLPDVLVPSSEADAETLSWEISGMPLLYRGLSQSTRDNQLKSLGMALGLVFVIMSVVFRSPLAGALATSPTALTLILVYGGMGLMGVHLDIGTSMLASIIIGAGVDYAVHLQASWRSPDSPEDAMARAVDDTAPAIWTNALMVAAGFFVLTLGEARPLQNVGGLTSAAMLIAAIATFVAIPVFARRRDYGTGPLDGAF